MKKILNSLTGLLAVITCATFATPHAQAMDCSTLWSHGFPDPTLPSRNVTCDEFRPNLTSLTPDLHMYLTDELRTSEPVKAQMEQIAEALQYSVNKYRTYGRVPHISLVRYPRPHYSEAAAFGFTFVQFFDINTEACPIVIYPLSEVLPKEHLQQMIAHEVFHCVQKANFKDEVTRAMASGGSEWWFEGLAQLFSNLVYPSADFEYTSRFPAPDQLFPFFEQENPYSSENFWQSYFNLVDSALFNVPSTVGTATGARAALRLPRISEALHNYAKEITRGKVRDASGANAPYRMNYETRSANRDAHQEITLVFTDFTVGAYEVKLPKGSNWNIHFDKPPETKISFKKAEDDDYTAVSGPFTMTSTCDEDRTVQMVVTRVGDGSVMPSAKLILDRTDNPDCDCRNPELPPMVDECLVGTWILDHSSVPQLWNRKMPDSTFLGSSGGFEVVIDANGDGRWNAQTWKIAARKALGNGMVMTFTQIMNGTTGFTSSSNAGKLCTTQTSASMNFTRIVDISGNSSTTHDTLPMTGARAMTTYTCSATELFYQTHSEGATSEVMNYIFHKR